MAEEMGVPFLGSIPIDPLIAESGDDGKAFVESAASSPAAGAFREIVRELALGEKNA
jgi:nitrogenase subunit NifH